MTCSTCGGALFYSGGCMGEWECDNPNCKEDGIRREKEKKETEITRLRVKIARLERELDE